MRLYIKLFGYKVGIGIFNKRYINTLPNVAFNNFPGMAFAFGIFGNKQYSRLNNKGIAVGNFKFEFTLQCGYKLLAGCGMRYPLVWVDMRLGEKPFSFYSNPIVNFTNLKRTATVGQVIKSYRFYIAFNYFAHANYLKDTLISFVN